jgi:hypothetical protein
VKRISFALAMTITVLAAWPAASLSVPLPEGRSYEQVTPVDKNGGDVGGPVLDGGFASALGQSASDGNSIGYASLASFADAQSADLFTYYISTRDSTGWSTHALSLPPAEPPRFLELPPFRAFAADLSAAVLGWAEPALVPEAPAGYTSIYLRAADGTSTLLTRDAPLNRLPGSYQASFAGATADLGRVVFEANDALLPEAAAEAWNVYEWSSQFGLRLVSVLPNEEAAPDATAGGAGEGDYAEVISGNGSRVFWTAEEQLYVREGGVRTLKLNASRREVSLGDGIATLLAISGNGSKAFFSDSTSLTDVAGDNGGLYEYDLEDETLRPLTPEPSPPEIEGVLGVSGDGSSVYFVSSAPLAADAQAGQPNLYVERAGALEFIATLSPRDALSWTLNRGERTSRVTADGARLAFLSHASLTGYDNTDAVSGEPVSELFVYDAGTDTVSCASCNPTGAPPIGPTTIPRGTPSSYQPNIFFGDGSRVFFNSADALIPRDSNHRQDVYVFADGKPQLISTGLSNDISALVDVGAGGRDVFFTTRSRLAAADRDDNSDVYDARVGGGFPEPQAPLPCSGEGCRGSLRTAPPPPSFPATALPGPEEPRTGKRPHRKRCRKHAGKARNRAEAAKVKRCKRGR